MKNIYNLFFATVVAFTLSACSNDNDSFDPYKNQVKKPFYPTTITFENSNNDGAKTDKKWQFTYNAEGRIKAYKYDYTIKASNGVQMLEEHSGELTYHKAPSTGNDVIQNSLTVNSSVVSTTAIESYTDKITELVDISNGTIQRSTCTSAQVQEPEPVSSLFIPPCSFCQADGARAASPATAQCLPPKRGRSSR